MTHLQWRRGGVLATLIIVGVGAFGCGGDGDTTTGAQTEPAKEPPREVVVQTAISGFDAVDVYRRAAPGVVTVSSIFRGGDGLLEGGSAGQGSGFVLNSGGEIVTNAHVVTQGDGANLEEADRVFVQFPDRNEVPAEIVGFDPFADVALLRVEPDELDLVPLRLGDDAQLEVGEPVAAIGSPFGETQSLSVGVVSALHRGVQSLTQFQIENAIQTDAAINPGNSGGPLLDAEARVIGINQQIETRSNANAGVGFAVPVSAIERSVAQLREDGRAEYAYIGVSSTPVWPQLAERLGLGTDHGALISQVVSGSPADDAELRAGNDRLTFQARPVRAGGDVILAIDGKRVIEPSDLARYISAHRPGDTITVEIERDGETQEIEVTLGTRPATAGP